jgi:hypothetical protein
LSDVERKRRAQEAKAEGNNCFSAKQNLKAAAWFSVAVCEMWMEFPVDDDFFTNQTSYNPL